MPLKASARLVREISWAEANRLGCERYQFQQLRHLHGKEHTRHYVMSAHGSGNKLYMEMQGTCMVVCLVCFAVIEATFCLGMAGVSTYHGS